MSFQNTRALIIGIVFAGVASACGGSQPAPETAPAASATSALPASMPADAGAKAAPAPTAEAAPAASAAPAKVAWKDMTVDQKKEVMKTQVIPQMGDLFKSFDAKRFPEVHCNTCHGPGAKEGKFDMPNPHLPKLDPKDGFAKHKAKDAKIVQFMMEQVTPTMAKILDVPGYDPSTHQGFGCFNCHTMAK